MGSLVLAVLVLTPAGSTAAIMAVSVKVLCLSFLLFGEAALGARQLRGNPNAASSRDARNLQNSFPFNQGTSDHAHEHHGDHHEAHQAVEARPARQGGDDASVSFADVAGARPGNDGKKCIDKVEMVEETEYDDVVQCDRSYDKRCHTTYVTNYESQQEEECEENYRKSCFIEYEQIAFNETVEICRTPLVKDCDVQGPEICRTEYESECWTKQEVHEVEDDVVECKTEI